MTPSVHEDVAFPCITSQPWHPMSQFHESPVRLSAITSCVHGDNPASFDHKLALTPCSHSKLCPRVTGLWTYPVSRDHPFGRTPSVHGLLATAIREHPVFTAYKAQPSDVPTYSIQNGFFKCDREHNMLTKCVVDDQMMTIMYLIDNYMLQT